MCGIIGIIGKSDVAPLLVDGLKRLEYRGYDSAGVATLVNGHIQRRRAKGKIANLEAALDDWPVAGTIGIGHTRWATHGAPSETNAHPHASKRVAVVHNGIIENFQDLREELSELGHVFESETDTEVVAHLVTEYLNRGNTPEQATALALKRLKGAFALGMIFAGHHQMIVAARQGSPLAIGYGNGEMFVGSDALALAPMTRRICYLEDGDWATVTLDGVLVRDRDGRLVDRPVRRTAVSGAVIGKGEHRHFMLKEIHEQPAVIAETLNTMFHPATRSIAMPDLPFDLRAVSRATIVACGTSYYAGLVAKYWLETVARLPVDVDLASEFRYRAPTLGAGGLAIFISQSGETADTLAALRYCRQNGQHVLSVVNVPESSIARESHGVMPTVAGPEIGVASTKAFTTQLAVLACFTIALARLRGTIDKAVEARLCQAVAEVPAKVADALAASAGVTAIARIVAEARDVLYLGRGTSYPIALEGALKLKEISYIHAEGYAAGEMKHGPIALIDENVPVIVVAPYDDLYDKTTSNVQEVVARGGKVIFISDARGLARLGSTRVAATLELPDADPFVTPILYAIPVQLLAYYTAVARGTDIDQPRNLAKSVTVE